MEFKTTMSSDSWIMCKLALNRLLNEYDTSLRENVELSKESRLSRVEFIENAKYWATRYKNVITAINELNQY